jgi:hypothetical protein
MVDFWRDIRGGTTFPKKVVYRATSPLYVGERYRIVMYEENEKVTEVRIVDSYGKTGMTALIESF